MKIRIIGNGRLAKSLIHQWQNEHAIIVSAPSLKNETIHKHLQTCTSNASHISDAKLIILAVKPALITTVLKEIYHRLSKDTLIISLAAAIDLDTLEKECPENVYITRVMPNIASEVKESASIALKNPNSLSEHQNIIEELFLTCGTLDWVALEEHLDLATILASSGLAYVFYFMEALEESATAMGLPEHMSLKLVKQTFKGALGLSEQDIYSLKQRREQVTSPKGITASAINVFENEDLGQIITLALKAAWEKTQKIQTSLS